MGTIDGRAWLEKRLKFLREALEGDELTESQRVLVETETEQLQAEADRDKHRFRRWLMLGGRRTP